MIINWRIRTIEALAEKIGPVAILIVDEVARDLGIEYPDIDSKTYSAFLMRLSRELPDDMSVMELANHKAIQNMLMPEDGRHEYTFPA